MTEMIERVARAICRTELFECGQGCCAPICMENLGVARDKCTRCKTVHNVLARAVIEAMREPSQHMKATGVNVLVDLNLDGPDGVGWYEVEALWDSMIDEALKEKPAPDESEAGT